MKDISGSDAVGVLKFYKETNRFSARDFEDSLSKKFIGDDGNIMPEYSQFHSNCPVCNAKIEKSTLAFKKQGYKHWHCQSCESLFTNPSLNNKTIHREVYGTTPYPFLESVNSSLQIQFDKKRFTKALKKLQEKGMEFENKGVLDFGTGTGYFLESCKDFGFKTLLGNDLLNSAVSIANNKYKLENVFLKDGLCDFDRITDEIGLISMWEFIDHINKPFLFLNKLLKRVHSGTYIIISMRNSDSLAAKILQEKCNMFLGHAHFNFWSNKAVEKLIDRPDLELIERYQYISEREVICNYLNYCAPYSTSDNNFDLIPSSEEIINKNQAYKHVIILQKK